jgi:glycosyltransferase involved in cell wall biosynthesis
MKDFLIITNYFPPEKGAASNRIFQLAEGLQKRGFIVSVTTPLPNYPTGEIFKAYKGKINQTSVENNIKIYRLWVYASNSKNKLLRLFSMLSYSISLICFFIFKKIPKIVFVQSPPLLVAFTCLFFLQSKNRKIILNVSDLWPMAGLKLGVFKKNFVYKLLEKIEHNNYRKASLIFGQSNEILQHVLSINQKKEIFLYRNFPNIKVEKINPIKEPSKKLKIVYAGLLGFAQGVLKLCQNLDYSKIELHIYGVGAEKNKINDFINNNSELPIIYHGEAKRKELHKLIQQYDVAIIPLIKRIYGSVPSKIFEYSKLGLPILYFGGGEGEQIVKDLELGWVAETGNYSDLNKVILNINKEEITVDFKTRINQIANSNFDFEKQLEKSVNTIIKSF